MNKVTSCCKATYRQEKIIGAGTYLYCNECNEICTLEDIPAHTESMEERFRSKFCNENINDSNTPIHSRYMNGGIGRMLSDMEDFIKSELERRDREIVDMLWQVREDWRNDGQIQALCTTDYLINLIKNK